MHCHSTAKVRCRMPTFILLRCDTVFLQFFGDFFSNFGDDFIGQVETAHRLIDTHFWYRGCVVSSAHGQLRSPGDRDFRSGPWSEKIWSCMVLSGWIQWDDRDLIVIWWGYLCDFMRILWGQYEKVVYILRWWSQFDCANSVRPAGETHAVRIHRNYTSIKCSVICSATVMIYICDFMSSYYATRSETHFSVPSFTFCQIPEMYCWYCWFCPLWNLPSGTFLHSCWTSPSIVDFPI